jgi:hypothetical protein
MPTDTCQTFRNDILTRCTARLLRYKYANILFIHIQNFEYLNSRWHFQHPSHIVKIEKYSNRVLKP